jgi:D-lactate dehydrogenase
MQVFFYEAFEEEAAAIRRYLRPDVDAGFTDKTIQEAGHAVPPARLISTRTQSILPEAWGAQLDAVLSRSTGWDHLAAWAAQTGPGIAWGYLPLYSHEAVAEHAMMLWLALLRRLPRQLRQMGAFHRDGLTGRQSAGRTLAVVGVGHIGREVCRLGRALRMEVLGVDLDPRHAEVRYVAPEEALRAADVVVCAMNLTAENRGYFDAGKLGWMKPDAVFVNIARGELSPQSLLLEALEAGRLGGVGLDVWDSERDLAVSLREGVPTEAPEALAALRMLERDDVIGTPHNAFNSEEAVERKSEHAVRQVHAWLADGAFLWPMPQASPSVSP